MRWGEGGDPLSGGGTANPMRMKWFLFKQWEHSSPHCSAVAASSSRIWRATLIKSTSHVVIVAAQHPTNRVRGAAVQHQQKRERSYIYVCVCMYVHQWRINRSSFTLFLFFFEGSAGQHPNRWFLIWLRFTLLHTPLSLLDDSSPLSWCWRWARDATAAACTCWWWWSHYIYFILFSFHSQLTHPPLPPFNSLF